MQQATDEPRTSSEPSRYGASSSDHMPNVRGTDNGARKQHPSLTEAQSAKRKQGFDLQLKHVDSNSLGVVDLSSLFSPLFPLFFLPFFLLLPPSPPFRGDLKVFHQHDLKALRLGLGLGSTQLTGQDRNVFLIVEKYPANLITKDRWGATPLLYSFWGAAPAEIIQFLLESYQSLYPGHVFNWTMMVETMGRCDTPKESIENLLCVKQMHFPSQPIDWVYLLDKFSSSSHSSFKLFFKERMQYLVNCGLSERVESLAFKVWRDHITNMIHTAKFECNGDNFGILRWIGARIAHFEDKYLKLKEITTILEFALWKLRMNENIPQEEVSHSHKKMRIDELEFRRQCRVTGGADVIIGHVLPFLITTV